MKDTSPQSSLIPRVTVSVLAFAAATIGTLALWDAAFQRVPFALYFAAVALAAWRAGWLAGIGVGVGGILAVSIHERFASYLLAPSLVLLGVSAVISLLTATRERALGALRDSERQYRLVVENVRDYAMFMVDPDGRVVRWNAGAERVLGWREDEIVGQRCAVIFTPEDREKGESEKEIETARREGHAADERWHQRKDGSRFFATGMMMKVLDEAGHHVGFTKVLRDMTARRQAELEVADARAQALAAVEAERGRLADVIKRAPSFMAVLRGPQHVFELVNDRYVEHVGRREIIGKPVREALPELAGQGFFELLDRVYATGEPYVGRDMRILLQRQPGEPADERVVEFVYQATREPDGSVSGVFVHGIDLTEHKRAEEALRESERRLRTFFESDMVGTIYWDMDGRVSDANERFLRIVGYEREDLAAGRVRWDDMTPPEYRHLDVRSVAEFKGTGFCTPYEKEYIRKDGSRVPVIVGGAMLDERRHEGVGFVLDNTDRKRAEAERQMLLESERAARAEAERAGRMKDEFLATLSHELRTPLNAILGWSQILRGNGGATGEDLAEGLATIERNARAQTQIIEDLLDMSRIISGKVRLDVQRLDLAAVVQAGIDTVRPAADAKGLRIQAILDPVAGPVTGDPNRLHQVFWNLLSNAVKFTPKDGRVQVLLERVNSHVEVSVIDTGQGIGPEFLPHVFDRFRQADASTTRRHGGLGLGLSIVKQLVELHGGSVRVKSAGAGHGTTFTVRLPLVVVHPEPEPEVERTHPSAATTASVPADLHREACLQLQGVRVLVVDDEADACAMVRRLLEDCGAVVTTASSAAEALEAFQRERPDVLVSDIGMAVEDGYTLIRRVRALGKDKGGNTPSLALTAYARPEDRMRAMRAGFHLHVVKPVEPVELITMVATLAERNGD